jgi:uncharacterized protein (TIGR02453 family)
MISPLTLNFITDLTANNNRDWFMANKERYEAARDNVIEFTGAVLKAVSKVDPYVDFNTDPKKCVMRIYRDIRFSKDKTPYKNHFGVHKLSQGRYAGGINYYLHIEPGKSFIAGGNWMPEGEHLKAIRQEIDYNAGELKDIVDAPKFKKLFGEFRDQEQLKSIPSGYPVTHEDISLLKLKSFVAAHNLTDAQLQKKDIADTIAEIFKEIQPLQMFLHNAIVV